MFYIQQDNKIIIYNEDKQIIQNTLELMPQYKNLDIQETDKNIIQFNGEFVFEEDVQSELAEQRKQEFQSKFLSTSLGNYRLQPKGYANAQQSIDTINNMVNALGSLTNQISEMILFYETPDFADETQCTEEWLVEHQHKAPVMTKEEWTSFYIEFSTLYAQSQYK